MHLLVPVWQVYQAMLLVKASTKWCICKHSATAHTRCLHEAMVYQTMCRLACRCCRHLLLFNSRPRWPMQSKI